MSFQQFLFILATLVWGVPLQGARLLHNEGQCMHGRELDPTGTSSWRFASLGIIVNATSNITLRDRDTPAGMRKQCRYKGSASWTELLFVNSGHYAPSKFKPIPLEGTAFWRSLHAHRSLVRYYEEGLEGKRRWVRAYMETPSGKVVLFQNNARTDGPETQETLGEQLAELLNHMETFSAEEPDGQEGVALVRLQQMPLGGRLLYADDSASVLVAYRSETNGHWLEAFDKGTGTTRMRKELKGISGIKAIDAHAGHFVALVEMTMPHHQVNVRGQQPEVRLHRYRMDGTLLLNVPVMAARDVTRVPDKAYSAYSIPSVALTHDRMAVSLGTTGTFSDGVTHLGEGNFIFDTDGRELFRDEWTVSHSFQQFVAKGHGRLSFLSVGDGFPHRAINGRSVNYDPEPRVAGKHPPSPPLLVRDLSRLLSPKDREPPERIEPEPYVNPGTHRYHFFPLPGETGENYVYDTHIAAAFHHHGTTMVFFESELYGGFRSDPVHIPASWLSKGPNQLFMNLRRGQHDDIKPLTRDHRLDHHITAAVKYPDGKVLLGLITFKAVEGSTYNSLKYGHLNPLEHDLAEHVVFDEYLMLLSPDGKVLHARIDHPSASDRYQIGSLLGLANSYKGHLFLNGEAPVLFRQVVNTIFMEFITVTI
jgi:hypothetical protein